MLLQTTEEFVWKPMTSTEDRCEVRTPLANMQDVGGLQTRFHLDVEASGIKRRLGNKKPPP